MGGGSGAAASPRRGEVGAKRQVRGANRLGFRAQPSDAATGAETRLRQARSGNRELYDGLSGAVGVFLPEPDLAPR